MQERTNEDPENWILSHDVNGEVRSLFQKWSPKDHNNPNSWTVTLNRFLTKQKDIQYKNWILRDNNLREQPTTEKNMFFFIEYVKWSVVL